MQLKNRIGLPFVRNSNRQRKKIFIQYSSIAFAILAISLFFIFVFPTFSTKKNTDDQIYSRQLFIDKWKLKNWTEVRKQASLVLRTQPTNNFYLIFSGMAAYYAAMDIPEGQERQSLLDESILTLRKTLAIGNRLHLPEIFYVLGKAYFEKGGWFLDQSIQFLEKSIKAKYNATDSFDFLGLAYSSRGDKNKALYYFEKALQKTRNSALLLATAKTYLELGKTDNAEVLLYEALSASKDELAWINGTLMLAEVVKSRNDFAKAISLYSKVIEVDPASVEAHYRLGLVYQEVGETIKARAEWRKAIGIDPLHAPSKQKLLEKL